jgi:hypothetical protein
VPELARLEPTARTAVDQLAHAGPAAATGIIPTLWIHLAEPPGLIEALARDLPAVLRSASFREAHGELTLLAAQPNPAERLAEPVRKCLQAFHQRIAEMVLIGVYLDTALSPHAEARP